MSREYELIKCPTCGDSRYDEEKGVYVCKTCDSVFFKATEEVTNSLNEAKRELEIYNFSKADRIYRSILNETKDEKTKVMCYFGRLLAYFGVVYVKDFNGNLVITIANYDPQFKNIKDSSYYKDIENSIYKDLYKEQLERLDREYQRIETELKKGIVYDVFICTKVSLKTKENPFIDGYTEDSFTALQIYDELTKKGLNVFYSAKVLKGIDYDAQIYSALMRSKNIIVITSKKEYLESPWVESEWQRWINFINRDIKSNDSLYLYIINGNHFELPPVLLRTQRFSDTLELVNRVDESFEKKENRHKVAFENNLKQLCKYKEDILRGNQDYVIKEVYDLYKDVLLEYNLNTDKYENTLSQKDRQIISELKNDNDKTKSVLSGIMGLKEANRKTNCKIVRDKYNQLGTFSKTLIYEDYKLLKLHEEILEFEELVESTLVYKNNNIIDSLEKINDVWEKYQSIQYTYSSMEVFTTTFSSENVAYKKLLQFEKNRIDEVVKNILDVKTVDNCILYTRYNFDCLNDYYKQREYISNNGKKQYRELLEETDKKYNQYSNDLEEMSKEIKEVEAKISLLQPGSKKIYEVRDGFYNLTKEQQNNVQNKNQLMTLLDNYNRDVRYSFNMTSRVLNIFTLILGIVLFIFLVLDISISITESISLTAVLSVVGMFLVVISSLSTIMLKLKTYGEKRNARNGRIAWYIFNYVVVILLIVLTMIFIPKLYEVLGNFRYKTLLIPLVLVLLSAVLNISNIKKFDTNDKLIDSKLFSGKLYLVLFVLLISLSNVSYKIEYDLSGGDLFGEPKSYGNIVSDIKLPIPTKEGYEFEGWYDNDDYNGEVLEVIAVGTTGNVKLYAKWTPIKYTIEYELKNGELEKGVYHYTLEEEVELPNAFKKGYKFLGWYDNNSYNGSPITKIEKGSTENFKLYARWEIIEYTIQYNLNGGIWGSKKGIETYNVLTDEELVIPEYAGYTFVGWYEDSDFNGSKVEKITEGTTGDKVLYARWNKVTYVINFLNPSGSSVKSITSLPNELITLPIPVHSNPKYYTFKGWKYNGEIIKQLKVTQNVTLEAVWEPEKYVITYDPNGGNVSTESDEFLYNAPYVFPEPTREGYIFDGWYYNNQRYLDGDSWNVAQNITLKAKWIAKEYTISFDANGGVPIEDVISVTYGEKYTLPLTKRNGFSFIGWFYNGKKCDGTNWTIDNKDIRLIAQWEACIVYFNSNGGTVAITEQLVNEDGTYGDLPTPERKGYAFVGWYTELEGGTKITKSSEADFEGLSTTLYAQWTKIETTIVLGNGQADRYRIRIWNSWGHNEDEHGKDTIHTELNRDELLNLGYTKIKVSMTFYYRVDDWGDQLIQIFSNMNKEVATFTYEWDERDWNQQTIEYELLLSSQVDSDCGFWIKWYLSKDGVNSDTWFVGGTTLSITASK